MRSLAWLVSVGIHLATPLGAFVGWALVAPLPAKPVWGDFVPDTRVQLNPISLAQGATEAEVDALFGVLSGGPRGSESRCVRYRYLPRLSYVMLFRGGVVESIWLEEGASTPYVCEGILRRTVLVRALPGLPTELARPAAECGCPPFHSPTCRVP